MIVIPRSPIARAASASAGTAGVNPLTNACPTARTCGLAAASATTAASSGFTDVARPPMTGIEREPRVVKAAPRAETRGAYLVSLCRSATSCAVLIFDTHTLTCCRPWVILSNPPPPRFVNDLTRSRTFFWTDRSVSATRLPQTTAWPPPVGLMNGSARSAPMSRHAALMRSTAPDHCCLTRSVVPPNLACMPAVMASRASSALIFPAVMSFLISAAVLPNAWPMSSAALMPRCPSWRRSWPVIFPAALIWARTNARSCRFWLDPPVAATAFWRASSMGIVFSTSTPKARSCCCAVMNAVFENGLRDARSLSLLICSLTAWVDPRSVFKAARLFCWSLL